MPVRNNVQATCPIVLPIWSAVLQTANGVGLWFYCLVRMVSSLTMPSCSVVGRLTTCLPDATRVDTRPWASTIPRLSYTTIRFMSATPLTRKTWNARSFLWQKRTKNGRFYAKYHVYGMRITCKRYCGVMKNAVPLHPEIIINFFKGKDYE